MGTDVMVAMGIVLALFIAGLCFAYVGARRADEEPPEPPRPPLGRQRKDRMTPEPYDRFWS